MNYNIILSKVYFYSIKILKTILNRLKNYLNSYNIIGKTNSRKQSTWIQ